jgi:hypothetical protein
MKILASDKWVAGDIRHSKYPVSRQIRYGCHKNRILRLWWISRMWKHCFSALNTHTRYENSLVKFGSVLTYFQEYEVRTYHCSVTPRKRNVALIRTLRTRSSRDKLIIPLSYDKKTTKFRWEIIICRHFLRVCVCVRARAPLIRSQGKKSALAFPASRFYCV